MFRLLQKEFLLGVGVGFIISAIMVSVFGTGNLSDQEIMTRAAKLGMVQKEQKGKQENPADVLSGKTTAEQVYNEVYENNSGKPAVPAAKTEASSSPVSVQVVIRSGTGSEQIARMLEEKGVVQDQHEFYKVVTEMKAHTRFRTGTFTVPAGGDMREIVEILTGNRKGK